MNLRGREPQGTVYPHEYEQLRTELTKKIEAIPGENGRPIGTKVFKPEQLYKACNGVAPDLLVYFGDLAWRSAGSVGLNSIHTLDTGPDDANHTPGQERREPFVTTSRIMPLSHGRSGDQSLTEGVTQFGIGELEKQFCNTAGMIQAKAKQEFNSLHL